MPILAGVASSLTYRRPLSLYSLEGLTLSEDGCGYVMDLLAANNSITELRSVPAHVRPRFVADSSSSLARNQLARAQLRVLEAGLPRAQALQSLK